MSRTSVIIHNDDFIDKEFICSHSPSDSITRWLHKILPLRFQHIIRDYGGVTWINNSVAVIVGSILCLSQPSLILEYIRISQRTRRILYDKSNNNHYIDLFNVPTSDKQHHGDNTHVESKVLVFVYGGAWGSGHTWMYRLCASNAAKCLGADHVVLIEYSTYPHARIDEQVMAVSKAISFLHDNPSIVFPSDNPFHDQKPPNMILMGHSSGANVSALCLHRHACMSMRYIDTFIASAGVYDIHKHYQWEEGRGLHQISPMSQAAHGHDNFDRYSPIVIADTVMSNNASFQYYPRVFFMHGLQDATVPISSSIDYARVLRAKGVSVCAGLPDYDHMDPILELTISSKSTTGLMLMGYINMITSDP